VHAFLASVLTETLDGYRLYWAVYVHPVSRLTPLYMALIEPFTDASSIRRSFVGSGEPGRSATHALSIHVPRVPSNE
jgi:hypothetical protein